MVLNVRYDVGDMIAGKSYLTPKAWDRQTNDLLPQTITFTPGEKFDFFYVGEWTEDPIADDDYENGFYDYMNSTYDGVYAVTSVSKLGVIPHFEITGK